MSIQLANLKPQPLHLLACSSFVPDVMAGEHSLDFLAQQGLSVQNPEILTRRHWRFAGTDEERLSDINKLFEQAPLSGLILATRGGYGATRILPKIDYKQLGPLLKQAGVPIVGYSDFGAIQLALLAQEEVGSFLGPMLSDFSTISPNTFMLKEFFSTLTTSGRTFYFAAPQAHQKQGHGLFWGGNLSIIHTLIGTPYFPDIPNGLLFLEDVSEPVYSIERMLIALHHTGVLAKQQAVFLGQFNPPADDYDPNYTLQVVIEDLQQRTGIPFFTGIPFGHIPEKTTLPIGFNATFITDQHGITLQFCDYPTLR